MSHMPFYMRLFKIYTKNVITKPVFPCRGFLRAYEGIVMVSVRWFRNFVESDGRVCKCEYAGFAG